MSFQITPGFELVANPQVLAPAALGKPQQATLSPAGFAKAKQEITSWPGYQPTPLIALDRAADALGLGQIYYKHEADRFNLGSFKALGGAYAVANLLKRELAKAGLCDEASYQDLTSGKYAEFISKVAVTCATDGNHGRSVAWGSQLFGCQCIIYIHATVSEGRKQAIEGFGAQVVRVPGNYDDAVRQADEDAKALGRFVVSDTSYPGYLEVPKDVMQGYTVMIDEAIGQLPKQQAPTHLFVQGGVGGLAAAAVAQLWQHFGDARPHCVIVEPDKADCLYQSARKGEPVVVHGELDTLMAGLACGEVSLLAWDILRDGASHFMTVSDESAVDCMRLLADNSACSSQGIEAGESAVAGLAGLILACQDPAARQQLQLDQHSRVLLIGSEGATDPELYHQLVTQALQQEQS
ncbi:diaminopropionate ammonia-lyase [Aliagarivorans taiwanensis]|uniref:diaminopropionate ammonia-lyase n=1 Tax=Aliagarivorans taiwanensis TaxID=561966 RepID=UPI00041A17F6|nr:diaminopropionate ammonia-lyase [Aliagarivorans taiwanensis]